KLTPRRWRAGLSLWAWVARHPALYHALSGIASRVLGWAGGRRGRFRSLPFAGGWTGVRDLPVPEGRSFHSLWAERSKRGAAR
ncbi:MAG: lactate utilization protein LutB domain-containing protein, partial [Stellaceae bacterium]